MKGYKMAYKVFKLQNKQINIHVLLVFLSRAILDHRVFQVLQVSLEEMGPLERILIQAQWVCLENR